MTGLAATAGRRACPAHRPDPTPLDAPPPPRSKRIRMPDHLPDHEAAQAWPATPCPYGIGEWWLAETTQGVLAIVPPGAVGDLDEPADARSGWRTLWWPAGLDYDDPWGADGAPARAQPISIADVLTLVGEAHIGRVRDRCERQLAHLRRFGTRLDGRLDDDRAREASRILSRLHRELDDAFALETWHARDEVAVKAVPDTAAELIHELDGTAPARAEQMFGRIQRGYWRAVNAYRKARRVSAGPQAMLSRIRERPAQSASRPGASNCDTGEHLTVGH